MPLNTPVFVFLPHELEFLAFFNVHPATLVYTGVKAEVVPTQPFRALKTARPINRTSVDRGQYRLADK